MYLIFKVAKQEEILRQERDKVDKEREEFQAQKQKFDEEMTRMAEMHQIQVLWSCVIPQLYFPKSQSQLRWQ